MLIKMTRISMLSDMSKTDERVENTARGTEPANTGAFLIPRLDATEYF